MPYTPELNTESCCILSRLAWAAGLPMTSVINQVFEVIPEIVDKEFVCAACKDNSKCDICGFNKIKEQDIVMVSLKDKKIRFKDYTEDI